MQIPLVFFLIIGLVAVCQQEQRIIVAALHLVHEVVELRRSNHCVHALAHNSLVLALVTCHPVRNARRIGYSGCLDGVLLRIVERVSNDISLNCAHPVDCSSSDHEENYQQLTTLDKSFHSVSYTHLTLPTILRV